MATTTFAFTGAAQSFVVPAGTTSVLIESWGAASFNGARGGYATGRLATTPGETLQVNVGGTNGFNGGGGPTALNHQGAGASDVRQGGTALANRKIVAGGAGGGTSGVGGGSVGGAGDSGGGGGTQTAGGIGGTSGSPTGGAGTLGLGGAGGINASSASQSGFGGGGGYFGGGGGGAGVTGAGVTGGGGSGYIGGVTSGFTIAGVRLGNGQIFITYNVAPNSPILNTPIGAVSINRTIVQRFGWTFSDPDVGDSQSAFDLRYRVVGASTWTTVYGSTPNAFWDAPAATFADATDYEWQVRTYDSGGLVGPYASSAFFTANAPPPGPVITAPTSGATVPGTTTLVWSQPTQDAYQVRRTSDTAGTIIYEDTGTVTDSGTRSKALTFSVNGRAEHLQVRTQYAALWSPWADITVTVSYTAPAVPLVTLTPDDPTGSMLVSIVNPTPAPSMSYRWTGTANASSSEELTNGVVTRTNIGTNPRAVAGNGGWDSAYGAFWAAEFVTSGFPAHPLGITTAARGHSVDPGAAGSAANFINMDNLGTTGPARSTGIWVCSIESGYQTSPRGTTGFVTPVPLTAGVWTFVKTSTPTLAGEIVGIGVTKTTGAAVSTDMVYVTGCVAEAGGVVGDYFDGSTPAVGGQPAVAYNDVWIDDGAGFERRATMLATNTPWRYWTPVGSRDYSASLQVVAAGSNDTTSTGSPA